METKIAQVSYQNFSMYDMCTSYIRILMAGPSELHSATYHQQQETDRRLVKQKFTTVIDNSKYNINNICIALVIPIIYDIVINMIMTTCCMDHTKSQTVCPLIYIIYIPIYISWRDERAMRIDPILLDRRHCFSVLL